MIIGSSMVQRAFQVEYFGFGIGLSDWYTRIADILWRGLGGYNSRWLLQGWKDIIGTNKPHLTIVFIGNNDANQDGLHVPLDEYEKNLSQIVSKLRELRSDMGIILVTPTRAAKSARTDETTSQYAEAVRKFHLADDRIVVLDLWIGEHAIYIEDLHDGMHLNKEGNKKLLESIKNVIRNYFPEYVPFTDYVNLQVKQFEEDASVKSLDYSFKSIPGLKWLFPSFRILRGKSIEESRSILNNNNNNNSHYVAPHN
jgi:lysophospholipase L1-like esterase